jgi:hypothetical protein
MSFAGVQEQDAVVAALQHDGRIALRLDALVRRELA